jgi:hypothetical protein
MGCGDLPVAYCFATLKAESFAEGTRSRPFTATLQSSSLHLDLSHGGCSIEGKQRLPIPKEISHLGKWAAALYAGIVKKLPRGYRLIWRTLEVSGVSKP